MSDSSIRKGKISSVNYDTGMARVTYKDRNESVTSEFPLLNFNGEYHMPKIGEDVLVAHLSNGSSHGVVLGPLWNQQNTPAETGKNLYRKDFSSQKGAAYIKYDDSTGEYIIKAANVTVDGINRTELEGPHVVIAANIDMQIEAAEIILQAETIKLAKDMDIDGGSAAVKALVAEFGLETVGGMLLKAGEELGISGASDVRLQAAGSLALQDSEYNTTLKDIMDRLKALEGRS